MRRSPLVLLLLAAAPAAAQTRLQKPILGTPTVVPAGPSWMTVGSDYPTHMVIKWAVVPGAARYRIYRTWTMEKRSLYYDEPASSLASTTEPGYATIGDNLLVSRARTFSLDTPYTYEVQAVFVDRGAGTEVYSTLNPTASAISLSFMAPGNVRGTTQPTSDKWALRLTLMWDPVPGASGYVLTGTSVSDRGGRYIFPKEYLYGPKTAAVIDASPEASFSDAYRLIRSPIRPGWTYTFCLSSLYPNGAHEDTVQSCATVAT